MSARILVIEDHPENLELMTYLLEAYGHQVIPAGAGTEGIEAARRERPDLIVCDIQLPDIDGLQVARHLRSSPELRGIPLVAVTAYAMVGDRERIMAAGFDSYLTKPIDVETFVKQLEVFLPRDSHGEVRAAHDDVEHPEQSGSSARITILAVDNLPINLELARSIFGPSGYRVFTAGSVGEALALARENECHLIVSDVCMTGGTGFDFLQTVRQDPKLHSIPFVLLTSTRLGEEDRQRGLELGADRYLCRPIEPGVLLTEIRECLREKGIQ